MAITRSGRGPTVVCLHAIGQGARDYARFAERLGDRFDIVALDWPGHGASAASNGPITGVHFADVLAAVLDALEITRATIIGNSIGGAAALLYASRHPERVSALVLCNPAGLQRVGFIARLVCRRMAAFFATGERGDEKYVGRFAKYYERDVLSAPAAAWRRQEIVADATATAGLLHRAWQGFAEPESDLRALAPTLNCAVLFAWAKDDRYVAWSRSRRAALSVPHHAVRLFEGNHTAFLEQPERFDQEFVSFVKNTARADAT